MLENWKKACIQIAYCLRSKHRILSVNYLICSQKVIYSRNNQLVCTDSAAQCPQCDNGRWIWWYQATQDFAIQEENFEVDVQTYVAWNFIIFNIQAAASRKSWKPLASHEGKARQKYAIKMTELWIECVFCCVSAFLAVVRLTCSFCISGLIVELLNSSQMTAILSDTVAIWWSACLYI